MNKKLRKLHGDQKASKLYEVYYRFWENNMTEEDRKTKFGMLRKTRKYCSNPECCGNPRKLSDKKNISLQEKICNIDYQEELEELNQRILKIK